MIMIAFGMFSSVTYAEEIEKVVQPEDIKAGLEIPASGKWIWQKINIWIFVFYLKVVYDVK